MSLTLFRSSHPEVFLRKRVLKMCSKFTGEKQCRSVISMLINFTMWSSNFFFFCIQLSPAFLIVQVFQSPGFSGSSFSRVQVFLSPSFSGSRVFQGPGPGSGSRVWVQVLEVALTTLLKPHFGMGVLLYICCIFSEHLFLGTPLDDCFWLLSFLNLT